MPAVELPLVEPIAVPDTFVTDLQDIEHLGSGIYRFTFVSRVKEEDQISYHYEIRLRIVISAAAVFRAATWALKAIGARCCGHFIPDRCSLH